MLYSSISHCLHFYYFRIRNSWIWCNNARHFKIHIQFSRPSILISKLNNLVQRLSTAWNKKKNSSIALSGLLTTNSYLSHLFFIFIFLFSLKDKCTKTVTIRSSTNILGLFSFSLKCKNYFTFSSPPSGVSSSSSAFSFWVKTK